LLKLTLHDVAPRGQYYLTGLVGLSQSRPVQGVGSSVGSITGPSVGSRVSPKAVGCKDSIVEGLAVIVGITVPLGTLGWGETDGPIGSDGAGDVVGNSMVGA
jgi:hypothetical protein